MVTDKQYIKAAQSHYLIEEGTLEVDDNAPISRESVAKEIEEGAYVQAWIWISKEDAEVI